MSTVQKQFNRAATQYDMYSDVQTKMAQELLTLLKGKTGSSSILDVGCGTGILTEAAHQSFPQAKITAMDIAENMIHIAREKLASPNIIFTVQDVEAEWKSDVSYDLILSNAVFQWLQYPQNTMHALTSQLREGGWLLASTFGPQTFCELTSVFREVEAELGLPSQAHHLPLKSGDDWSLLLKVCGLKHIEIMQKQERAHYPNCREFLYAVKAIGAGYSEARLSVTMQKKVLQEVIKRYDKRYRINDSVFATYHLIYIQGKR